MADYNELFFQLGTQFANALKEKWANENKQKALTDFQNVSQGVHPVEPGTPGATWYSPDNSYRAPNDMSTPAVQASFLNLARVDPNTAGMAMKLQEMNDAEKERNRPLFTQKEIPGVGLVQMQVDRRTGFASSVQTNTPPWTGSQSSVPGLLFPAIKTPSPVTYDPKGVTEKGNQTVVTDNSTGQLLVGDDPKTRVPYNSKVHGQIRPLTTTPNANNPEFANSWQPDQATIDMIGRNEIPLDKAIPGQRGVMGVIFRSKAIAAVKAQYPDWEYYTSQNIGSMEKDYQPGGRVGQKAIQLNTAITHSSRIVEAAKALANGDTPLFNDLANKYRDVFGGEGLPPQRRLAAAIDAYAGELGSLLKSGNASATEFDVQNLLEGLKLKDPPETIAATVSELTQLGADKLAENDKAYYNIRGKLWKGTGLLGKEQKDYMQKIGLKLNGVYGGTSEQSAPNYDDFQNWLKGKK